MVKKLFDEYAFNLKYIKQTLVNKEHPFYAGPKQIRVWLRRGYSLLQRVKCVTSPLRERGGDDVD
jgi:hypothetical protein